jgi:hypothetical protein
MDFNELTENIKQKLIDNGYSKYSIDIDECISEGSTGTEITFLVGKYLVDLKVNDKIVYDLIETEVTNYIKFAKNIGLEIK